VGYGEKALSPPPTTFEALLEFMTDNHDPLLKPEIRIRKSGIFLSWIKSNISEAGNMCEEKAEISSCPK
jgi:hypothetical protein